MEALIRQLATLPARYGPPPEMTPANPQEQLSQQPADGHWAAALTAFGLALPAVVARPTLVAPDGALAFTLAAGVPLNPLAVMAGREFAHLHQAPRASLHMMLPAPARAILLAKGWGVRHPFAERGLGPVATVFVYAPRDAEELVRVQALLALSHAWARDTTIGEDA